MRLLLATASLAALTVVAGCATTAPKTAGAPGGATVRVVAAESFWGSLAQQLGGAHAAVNSIINNPDADPHDYEPTAADGRAIAGAQLAVVNGIGYDTWAGKLVDANPAGGRTVLTVGDLVGAKEGDNPHRWYNPDNVRTVIDAIDQIKSAYAGTPVGASESIFAMLAPALGLKLLTPESFLNAISEGNDPTAADKATVDAQIRNRQIKVYVYNSQNATPDVQAQVAAAKAAGIAVTTITETLTPAGASFQDWQVSQLAALKQALAGATAK